MKKFTTLLTAFLLTLQLLAQDYKAGTKVEILWSGSWYKGSVIEVKEKQYKITYEGWTSYWDEWVGKDRLRLPGTKAAPAAAKTTTTTTQTNNSTGFAVTEKAATPDQTGAQPAAGKWEATVTNGYKGDKITFTVAADGKTIKDVEFKGYWKDQGTIAILENLDPPNPFVVTKGGFSAVQQVEKARMWWEFTGRFVTSTTAEGTYRAAFAGGSSDTYKLKWTAKRVGK